MGRRAVLAVCTLYPFLLLGVSLLSFTGGDRLAWVGLANLFAVYAFAPLALILPLAVIGRRRLLWIGLTLCGLVFLWAWGAQFSPARLIDRQAQAQADTLTVMTYNVLARHEFSAAIIATIRAENPDVVLIQELNSGLAQALDEELSPLYPYQVLAPVDSPAGMGVIAKYPLKTSSHVLLIDSQDLPGPWVGEPLWVEMEWNGHQVGLVNFHLFATNSLLPPGGLRRHFHIRESQAALLAAAAEQAGPVILGGDANASPQNQAIRILGRSLEDAWRQAGFGLGRTFPGSDIPGSDRPTIGPFLAPMWVVRIDYIFYSQDWQAVDARVAAFDGVSDHRGVIAVLRLR